MSTNDKQRLILFRTGEAATAAPEIIATLLAPRVIICSQYADLRDEQDKLMATLTWTTPVQAKVVK